jgi:hypothetical protein
MSVADFEGSIAQLFMNFSVQQVNSTVSGQQYYSVGILIDSVAYMPTEMQSGYQVLDTPYLVSQGSYTSVVVAGSVLAAQLASFFAISPNTLVYLVNYDGTAHNVSAAYTAIDQYAYWKTLFMVGTETTQYLADLTALCLLGTGDTIGSQVFAWTVDTKLLTGAAGNLAASLITAGTDAYLCYSATTAYNSALDALGASLSFLNPTGTPVGNKTDYNAMLGVLPSTGVIGTNLTQAQIAELQTLNTAFIETRGLLDGSVAMNGLYTVAGKVVAANWFTAYYNFMCKTLTAQYLTSPGNTYKNNQTYQAILGILNNMASKFQNAGILSNFVITASTFSGLPSAPIGSITIPNAWTGDFASRIGNVTVNGTLFNI